MQGLATKPLKFSKLCTSCSLADGGTCPSYPFPVGDCEQYRKHEESYHWWAGVSQEKGADGD